MSEPQTVIVRKEGGCGSGCLPAFAVLAVVGLAYEYWYVTLPLLALTVAAFALYRRSEIGYWPWDEPPPATASAADPNSGCWDIDPLNPNRERWRQNGEWTDAVRPRQTWD